MRKLLLGVLPFVFMAFSYADWVTVNLSERVSADFPSDPVKTSMGGNDVWVNDSDSASRYLAMVIDFSKFGLDSAMLSAQLKEDKFYKDFQTSMLAQMEGATLISEEVTKVKGWPAYKLVVDLGKKDAKVNKLHCWNIFVGGAMYTLSFYENVNKPREADKAKFFDSVKIK